MGGNDTKPEVAVKLQLLVHTESLISKTSSVLSLLFKIRSDIIIGKFEEGFLADFRALLLVNTIKSHCAVVDTALLELYELLKQSVLGNCYTEVLQSDFDRIRDTKMNLEVPTPSQAIAKILQSKTCSKDE